MVTSRADAIIQAGGTIGAAIVIALGAWVATILAAELFEPKFVRWGNYVANIEHIILIGEQDDRSGCSVILTTTVQRVFETSDGRIRTGMSGHTVDSDAECEAIRTAVQEYTIDARGETDGQE